MTTLVPLRNREIQTRTRGIVSVQDYYGVKGKTRDIKSRNCFSVNHSRPRPANITPLSSSRFQIKSSHNVKDDILREQESKWNILPPKIDRPWKTLKFKHLEEINKTMKSKQRQYYESELRDMKMEHLDPTLSEQETNLTFQYKVNIDEDNETSSESESIANSKIVRFNTKETLYTKQPSSCMSKMQIKSKKSISKIGLDSKEAPVSIVGEARADTMFDRLKKRCCTKIARVRRKPQGNTLPSLDNKVSFIVKSTLARAMREGKDYKENKTLEEYEKKAMRDDMYSWGMYRAMSHKKHFPVKESDIPVEVLFNEDINQIKMEEIEFKVMPKPIIFNIVDDGDTNFVRYEIEGGRRIIETAFVRKNEEAFFNFLADFDANEVKERIKSKNSYNSKHNTKRESKHSIIRITSRMSKLSYASSVSRGSSSSKNSRAFSKISNRKSIISPENKILASKFKNLHRNSKITESNISVSRHSTQRVSKLMNNSEFDDTVHRISIIDESRNKMPNVNEGKRLTLTVPNPNFLFNSSKRKSEILVESGGSETPSNNEHRSINNQ